jgi:hypothetical protein
MTGLSLIVNHIYQRKLFCSRLKESELNDHLAEMKQKCLILSQTNETYERLLKENDDSIRMFKDELNNVKMRCMRLTMDNEKLNYTLQSKCENFKMVNETLSNLATENDKLKVKFDVCALINVRFCCVSTESSNFLHALVLVQREQKLG